MSLSMTTSSNLNLSEEVARQIAEGLTKAESAMQKEMWDVVAVKAGRLHPKNLPYSYLAVVSLSDELTGEMRVIGWGATRMWRGEQTFECFISEGHRRSGLATACLAALLIDKRIYPGHSLAVFSTETEKLCKKHGYSVVNSYYWDGGDWKRSTGEIVAVPKKTNASETYAYL